MRTKFISVLLKIVFSTLLLALGWQSFALWNGDTMKVSEAEERWGKASFDAKKFRDAKSKDRATMVSTLMRTNPFKGKSYKEVKAALGPSDGYYFSDYYPAYLIQEGWADGKDTWQVVFMLDKNRNVEDVILHKNCCSR